MKRLLALAGVAGLVLTAATAGPAGAEAGPTPGSPAYMARDVANIVNAFGRNQAQLTSPAYLEGLPRDIASRWIAQMKTQAANPADPALTGGNLIPGWNAGNPARAGWAGSRGREVAVHFTDADGAVLSGTLFAPLAKARDPYTHQPITYPLPGVVITTGSIQASAGVYSWLAEDLAERGYLVLTFDVQGQGTSETFPHQGPNSALPGCGTRAGAGQATACAGFPSEQQQNFDQDTEDAITFLLSSPARRYPNVHTGTSSVDPYDPLWTLFDRSPDHHTVTPGRTTRVALIGHSTGAVTTSYLQGIDPRIEAAVALDKITATPNAISDDQAGLGSLPGPVVPKVPILGIQSEYGFEPQPYWEASCSSFEPCPAAPGGSAAPPDLSKAPNPRREEQTGFDTWVAHGVDSMLIVPRASTHLDYTDEPPILPASAWGQAMASYYTQAWLDEYLKHEPGAAQRLLATSLPYLQPVGHGVWKPVTINRNQDLSFYFCSGYAIHVGGRRLKNTDLVGDGCS
ncbi:MAG: alpha/beta hydrolase family protein [Acidimicrobiales bacterium]